MTPHKTSESTCPKIGTSVLQANSEDYMDGSRHPYSLCPPQKMGSCGPHGVTPSPKYISPLRNGILVMELPSFQVKSGSHQVTQKMARHLCDPLSMPTCRSG